MARFKRILLKLSGESLMGEKQYGIDEKRLGEYAQQIKEIHDLGVQIGIVIGGGNIFRGLSGASQPVPPPHSAPCHYKQPPYLHSPPPPAAYPDSHKGPT